MTTVSALDTNKWYNRVSLLTCPVLNMYRVFDCAVTRHTFGSSLLVGSQGRLAPGWAVELAVVRHICAEKGKPHCVIYLLSYKVNSWRKESKVMKRKPSGCRGANTSSCSLSDDPMCRFSTFSSHLSLIIFSQWASSPSWRWECGCCRRVDGWLTV